MKLVEPPSCRAAAFSLVFIGKNHSGQWVAQEQNALYGGLFVNRAEAFKYAFSENGHRPEAIVELSREIELETGMAARSSEMSLAPKASSAKWLSGYIPDIPTPFDATGAIDLRAFAAALRATDRSRCFRHRSLRECGRGIDIVRR